MRLTKPVVIACSLFLSLLIFLPGIAQAKIVGYVTDDKNQLYEYDFDDLLDSYVDKLMGSKAILYNEFIKYPVTIVLDDINGYVDYDSVVDSYVDALLAGKPFDAHAYTSGPGAFIVPVDKVRVVTEENGKLVFIDKFFVEIAMAKVNVADSAASLREALEKYALPLELNLDKYNGLSEYGKDLAASNILQQRGSGFADIQALGTLFDQEVQQLVDNPQLVVLHQANSVSSATALRLVLEEHAQVLELDLSQYQDLGNYSKAAVVQAVYARRGDGFADIQAVRDIFAEELTKFLAEVEQIIILVNDTENLQDLEAIFAEYGKVIGLEMDTYNLLLPSRQLTLLEDIYARIPYASLEELRKTFNEAVATMLTSYSIITFSHYDRTLQQVVDKQMTVNPQWWWDKRWTSAPREQVQYYIDPTNFVPEELAETVFEIVIDVPDLRVRAEPTTNSERVVNVYEGEYFSVEAVQKGLEGTLPGTEGYWFKITKDGVSGWVCGKYANWVFEQGPGWLDNVANRKMLQFLVLSGPSGATESDIGVIIQGRGTLDGQEAAFYQASQEHGINEIFLAVLARHESGNGTSVLAEGILFDPEDGRPAKKVFNMFGIGAYDSDPNYYGALRAYNEGWFSPEEAIIGGAKFAGERYVYRTPNTQDTLYKMRWNPEIPASHQYATDIGWAYKQAISSNYSLMGTHNLKFDIPVYLPDSK